MGIPKRTRSFPYARVYDTLHKKSRVTLIPFCKDEGIDGDRDFIQWDTVSLMSLLNVYVIIGYYKKAERNNRPSQKHKDKITNQVYDYDHVTEQLLELHNYHSSALHWNLKQMEQLHLVAHHTLKAYEKISRQLGVRLHGSSTIHKRISLLQNNLEGFRNLSRQLAEQAQHREKVTMQPKESIVAEKKTITLKNLLGGFYFLTLDEYIMKNNCALLIEKKHTENHTIPSVNDIKDGCLKMALFANIDRLFYGKNQLHYKAVLGLTSPHIQSFLHNGMESEKINNFFGANSFHPKEATSLRSLLHEAHCNRFHFFVTNSHDMDYQSHIMSLLSFS